MDKPITMARFEDERRHVERLLGLIEGETVEIRDPNKGGREETGVDVVCVTAGNDGSEIGIQVTEYNPDEGQEVAPKQQSRAVDKRRAAEELKSDEPIKSYGMSVSAGYIEALKKRIKDKLLKSTIRFDEVWMLIAAQNPRWGESSSTFLAAEQVSLAELDACLHPLLTGSHFDRVFLLLETEEVVFEWSPTTKWQNVADKRVPPDPARVADLRKKLRLS
jgi:hypothetical protein